MYKGKIKNFFITNSVSIVIYLIPLIPTILGVIVDNISCVFFGILAFLLIFIIAKVNKLNKNISLIKETVCLINNQYESLASTEAEYKFLKMTITMDFIAREKINYTIDAEYEVLTPNLEEIPFNLVWSIGENFDSTITSPNNDHSLKFEDNKSIMSVILPGNMSVNETGKYQIFSELSDKEHKMQPISSKIINCSIESLTLVVIAPKNMIHRVVKCHSKGIAIFNNATDGKIDKIILGTKEHYSYNVPIEILQKVDGLSYGIQWVFVQD